MTAVYFALPYVLLLLSAIGFVLLFIADHFHVKHRVNLGVLLVFLACIAVMGMH